MKTRKMAMMATAGAGAFALMAAHLAIPGIALLLAGMAIPPLLVFVSILAPFITGETSFIPMLIL
jgi:fatty acid desaturase